MQRTRECWREKPEGGVFTTVRLISLHLSIPHSGRSICGRGYSCLFSCHHRPLGLTRTKSIEFRSYLQIPAMAKCIREKTSFKIQNSKR
nr:hypothetical protein CFP56_53986 [Quercus suber]